MNLPHINMRRAPVIRGAPRLFLHHAAISNQFAILLIADRFQPLVEAVLSRHL